MPPDASPLFALLVGFLFYERTNQWPLLFRHWHCCPRCLPHGSRSSIACERSEKASAERESVRHRHRETPRNRPAGHRGFRFCPFALRRSYTQEVSCGGRQNRQKGKRWENEGERVAGSPGDKQESVDLLLIDASFPHDMTSPGKVPSCIVTYADVFLSCLQTDSVGRVWLHLCVMVHGQPFSLLLFHTSLSLFANHPPSLSSPQQGGLPGPGLAVRSRDLMQGGS